jgi:Glyoxalase/Bleomycin resistance protein/Dioxygenase superfamily
MFEGKHFQNAYVTRNIQRAIEDFKSKANVRTLLTYEGTTDVVTPTGPGTVSSKLAFIWVDDLQYEFIEPVGGTVSLYRDALPGDDSLLFHHICMRVDDWDDFRARVRTQPLEVAIEGGNDALRYLYLDARPILGHYLEYVWMTPERWAQVGGR